MNKYDIQKRVLKNGEPIGLDDFTWCEDTRTFSSSLDGLILDFRGINNVLFNTGYSCTFDTGYGCTFDTGNDCTFKTGGSCTFKTASHCTFDTGSCCTFNTGSCCTFNTGSSCTFDTGNDCTFKTGGSCTFKTGSDCVVIRRGTVFEIIQLVAGQKIKLNGYGNKGYEISEDKHEIIIDGKKIELSKESYQQLKESLNE